MRGLKIVMMLFLAVLIAPSAFEKTGETAQHTTLQPDRIILSYPRIETYSNQNVILAANKPTLFIEQYLKTEEKVSSNTIEPQQQTVQAVTQSTGLLASRGGTLNTTPSYSEEDVYWLSRVISAEAKGENIEGQMAVGAVVMNRVQHPRFPKTIKGVIFANGQFDPVRDGSIYDEPVPSAVEAAKRVLQGDNPVPGAYYFYNPNISSDPWIRTLRVIKQIGNHVFAAAS